MPQILLAPADGLVVDVVPAPDAVVASAPGPLGRRGGWWVAVRRGKRVAAGVLAFLIVGNLAILGASLAAGRVVQGAAVAGVAGLGNLRAVDAKVWRGAAPDAAGYAALAEAGVTTVVDLRAEHGVGVDHDVARSLGLDVVALPIRDGQLPTTTQLRTFLEVVAAAPGTVYLHCGAGVGRTGAMAAGYLVATHQASGRRAALRNLEVGPPSLEQVLYAATGGTEHPLVTGASRVLDAPRRIAHTLGW